MYRGRIRRVHFVGIGGSGMSGIAEVLVNMGFRVSGSDLKASETTERLGSIGVKVHIGHSPENVEGADVVVYSSAVRRDNPEILAALERHIPVIPRAEMLAELMRMKHGIAVAGTHGKTTTTSLIATVLYHGGMDPTVVIGGRLNSIGSNARLGKGEFLVAEADESDRTFLLLTPTIAVVTNIDREHMESYGTMDRVREGYLQFINSIPFYGLAVLNLDHPNIQALLPGVKKRFVTYGRSIQADIRACDLKRRGIYTTFHVRCHGRELGKVNLPMPGEHNVYNALATIGVAMELGMPFRVIKEALESFTGVHRRFEIKAIVDGIVVIDDYGHHPVEIKAVLKAAREGWEKRMVVVFQPHRFTRTKDLYSDFLTAFNEADCLILTEIYPAGEEPIEGIDGALLYRGIKGAGHKNVLFIEDKGTIADRLMEMSRPGDMIIFLGAGDIWQVCDDFVRRLKGLSEAAGRGA